MAHELAQLVVLLGHQCEAWTHAQFRSDPLMAAVAPVQRGRAAFTAPVQSAAQNVSQSHDPLSPLASTASTT